MTRKWSNELHGIAQNVIQVVRFVINLPEALVTTPFGKGDVDTWWPSELCKYSDSFCILKLTNK